MSKYSCELYPKADNGEDSELYKKLLSLIHDRPTVNYWYAAYKASDAAEKMDQAGFTRNTQGEHKAEDYLNFIHWDDLQIEMTDIRMAERQLGAIDYNGNRVAFNDAKEALNKADHFNDTHKGLTARVTKIGDVYNIIVNEKTSRTNDFSTDVKQRLKVWDLYRQVFSNAGVDIENMPNQVKDTFNAYNSKLAQRLRDLQNMQMENMYKDEASLLLYSDLKSQAVQNIIHKFGSIENASEMLANYNRGTIKLDSSQKTLLARAIMHCQKFYGIDLKTLSSQVNDMMGQVESESPEKMIAEELHKLNKKYNIDINEIHRINDDIRTLSDAAAEAAIVLQRKIRELEKERGHNEEGKKLSSLLNQLMKELSCKRYCSGVLEFLNEATTEASLVDDILKHASSGTGTEMDQIFSMTKAIQKVKSIKEQYYNIVSALANESLAFDESISKTDVDNIRKTAKKLKDFYDKEFDDNISVVKDLSKMTMVNLLRKIIGNKAKDGQSIVNIVEMAATDSSVFDGFLYSMGKASNPVIAAAGAILENAQMSRDNIMNGISLRIRKATDKLYKSGSDSSFMYEDDGHIISDIDWKAYEMARSNAQKSLYMQGLRGFDLKQAIENWEDENTVDRIVDQTNHRTEKVPDAKFMKPFPKLTEAQMEYYETMMQIKGELGSMLPVYAQRQYLPPQVRRNMVDAISEAKDAGDVVKAVWNKVKNFATVREDDTEFARNGIVDGSSYDIMESSYDNTPLRQIPIFFVNKVEQGELLKDFSSGLAALASTAINYDAMNNIVDTMEFMRDFTANQKGSGADPKADVVENQFIRLFKDLWKYGKKTNTSKIIEGFISRDIYGQKIDEKSQKHSRFTKAVKNIIAYTSFKGLASNLPGALANYIMGELQMIIEAGGGEFYGGKDLLWAHTKLFGRAGAAGDIMELLTNNVSHKSVLFREMFDPMQENYDTKGHTRYHKSMFRQLMSHDCSFIGYEAGEYLIHYVNMYAVLHNRKVRLNGKKISLFDAFEVTNKEDGNSELKIKEGVTTLSGDPIDQSFLDNVRREVKYVNQSTHGAMDNESKGLIHKFLLGCLVMNFRQWMVGHYSRRYRKKYFDSTLGEWREGYYVSTFHALFNEDTKDKWNNGKKLNAVGRFLLDCLKFMFTTSVQWHNLDNMQRANVKRARSEVWMWVALLGLSFTLGEPDDHKRDFWRRWWIYQVRRMILDTEASMPVPYSINNFLTILNSPMAAVNTLNGLLYVFYGLANGDITEEIQSGPHEGENRYFRNVRKYALPFYKDIERLETMDTDEALFKVMEPSPANH